MDHQLQREIESFIEAYEDACQFGVLPADRLTDFLPQNIYSDLYRHSAIELIRVDMELRWNEFNGSPIDLYRSHFPHLLADPKTRQIVEFEYNRLQAVNTPEDIPLQTSLRQLEENVSTASKHFDNLSATFPIAGERFSEFELLEEIGRGAFGVVFIAKQSELANRTVVLKISPVSSIEADRLAQLQHTNIVPIFSIHREGPLQAICMPMLGRNTLANATTRKNSATHHLVSAQDLISTLRESPVPRTTPIAPSINSSHDGISGNDESDSEFATEKLAENLAKTEAANRCKSDRNLSDNSFRDLNYVHAIVWMVQQIAEGLAHAHARGVLHLDVKPANVLIGDDSIPRLLDFHVSTDYKANETIQIVHGGTMPYMSKEHMDAFLGIGKVDTRADIFSLGVVLYQLLCNGLPFPQPSGSIEQIYTSMVKDRTAQPRTDRFHPQASPGLIAITLRCLAPYEQRYQSMDEVIEDLRRHLNHLPLKHAPNHSLSERGAKFCRRHPTATSTSSLVTIGLMLFAFLAYGWWTQSQRSAQSEAIINAEQLHLSLKKQRLNFIGEQLGINTPPAEGATVNHSFASLFAPANATNSHVSYDSSDWLEQIQRLPPAKRTQVLADIAESMSLQRIITDSASAASIDSGSLGSLTSDIISQLPTEALDMASTNDPQWTRTQSILSSKIAIYRSLKFRQPGWIQKIEKDIALLESLDATDPSLALFRAMASRNKGEYRDAEMHYWTFLSIDPAATEAYLFRGFARLESGRNLDALSDFERVLQRWPTWTPVMINAAIACQKMNNHAKAIEYLNRALANNSNQVQPLILRSRSRLQLKDQDGANQDRNNAIKATPINATEWVMRGNERLDSDLDGAVADFKQAISLDPANFEAFQNLAHVYSDRKPDLKLAQQYLSQAIESRPSDTIAIVSRGVLHARAGDRNEALRDAADAEQKSTAALIHYQIACIHSLLLKPDSDPESEAAIAKHLSKALTADASLVPVAIQDPDLENARKLLEVQGILSAVNYIQSTVSKHNLNTTLAPKLNAESTNTRASEP